MSNVSNQHSSVIDGVISPCSDDANSMKKPSTWNEDDNEGIYEDIDFPPAANPHFKLEKLQRFLFSTSNDLRRTDKGGYRVRRRTSGGKFEEIIENVQAGKSTSSQSTWRAKWSAAITVSKPLRPILHLLKKTITGGAKVP